MRRPGENPPDPPGGRAAERLREFQRQHPQFEPPQNEQEADPAKDVPVDPNPSRGPDSNEKCRN